MVKGPFDSPLFSLFQICIGETAFSNIFRVFLSWPSAPTSLPVPSAVKGVSPFKASNDKLQTAAAEARDKRNISLACPSALSCSVPEGAFPHFPLPPFSKSAENEVHQESESQNWFSISPALTKVTIASKYIAKDTTLLIFGPLKGSHLPDSYLSPKVQQVQTVRQGFPTLATHGGTFTWGSRSPDLRDQISNFSHFVQVLV